MALLPLVSAVAPIHLLAWACLLGMQVYQSLVLTKLCHQHLPMLHFAELQRKVLPVYLSLQTTLSLLVFATFPPHLRPLPVWSAILPLSIGFTLSALNWVVYGPRASDAMKQRVRQETEDAAKAGDVPSKEDSVALKAIKKDYKEAQTTSIQLNAAAMVATAWYGIGLAARINFA